MARNRRGPSRCIGQDGSYVKHSERLTCDRDRGGNRPESRGQARGPCPSSYRIPTWMTSCDLPVVAAFTRARNLRLRGPHTLQCRTSHGVMPHDLALKIIVDRVKLAIALAFVVGLRVLAVSTKFSDFIPLISSAPALPVDGPEEATPITLSNPKWSQRTVADRRTQNQLVSIELGQLGHDHLKRNRAVSGTLPVHALRNRARPASSGSISRILTTSSAP